MLLDHPCIVRCYGSIELPTLLCTVLDRVLGESLAHLITREGALSEGRCAPIVLQVARALRHCHERKVSHRDVKADNVMVAPTGHAVLIDFGLALLQRTKGGRLDVRCGSSEYTAPEMLEITGGKQASKGYHGPAVDAWALGVLAYVALVGAFPFGTVQSRILQGRYARSAQLDKVPSARAFLDALLVVDPNSEMKINRMTMVDACKHPWLTPHTGAADALGAAAVEGRLAAESELLVSVREEREAAKARLLAAAGGPLASDVGGAPPATPGEVAPRRGEAQ